MKPYLLRCLSAGMFLLCTYAFADKVSITTARYTAMQFFSQHGDTRSGAFIRKSMQQEELLNDSTYLFVNGNGRFVLVSGRNDLPPILGYGEYQDTIPHEGFQKLAKMMGNGKYMFQQELSSTPILPLLKTIRSQNDPFNGSCPYFLDDGKQVDTKRCKVGCVATALEEILTYYQYPQELKDTLWGWKTAHYGVDTIPKGTKIDFDQILNVYEAGHYSDEQAHAVANLCYYCGIAAKMNWGLSSSGADGEQLVAPLKRVFGYRYVRHLYATNYTPQRWRELIDKELNEGRPLWFAGYTYYISGHAFVIDGKDSNGFYHIHWGYGGNYDGYYDLSVLNTFENPSRPTETGKWMGNYCDQEVLLLHPDSVKWTDGDTIRLKDNLRIDSVHYLRKPDGNAYVTIKIYAKNISEEPINAAVEMLTYKPGDTAIFKNADYVGMLGSDIAPHESVCLTAYCHFTETGERVFGITADGKSFVFKVPKLIVSVIMKKENVIIHFESCNFDALNETDKELVNTAKSIAERSYAPYSEFHVGCALRLENGVLLQGSNQENASYPCGSCAERTTLFYTQANYPDGVIQDIAIAAETRDAFTAQPLPPCGLCRQELLEAENRQKSPIRLLMYGTSRIIIIKGMANLLPFQFDAEMLE